MARHSRQMSFALVAAAAVAVAVSGMAAHEAFAEPEIALDPRGEAEDTGQTFLNGGNDVKVFTYNGRTYAVVSAFIEGAHLLDITNPSAINPLNDGGQQSRNVQPSAGRITAVAEYTVGGKPYFIVTWSVSNAIQAFKIAEPGDRDGSGGAIKKVGTLVNRPNVLINAAMLGGASDLFIYSVGNKHYAAVTAEGVDRLTVVEVTDPNALGAHGSVKGSIADSGSLLLDGPSGIEHYQTNNRHYAVVVSSGDNGIQIVDITDPSNPTAADHLTDTGALLLDGAEGVAIYSVGGRTYAVVASSVDDGIQIIDITDPDDIFPVGKLGDTGSLLLDRVQDVAVHTIGERHYAVVTSLAEDGIQVVDVTNPYNPVPKANIGDNAVRELWGATGVDTFSIGDRHYAIVASDSDQGVQIIEMTAVTADAGDGQSTPTGQTVTLDGSASTVSRAVTPTYLWTQTGGQTVTLSGTTTERPTFTAPNEPSTLIFKLAVTHRTATSTDIVSVSVAPDAAGSADKTAVDLALRDSQIDTGQTFLNTAYDVKVFTHNDRIYAIVAASEEGAHLLDVTNPASIGPLNNGGQSQRNVQPSNADFRAVAVYTGNDGKTYFVGTWATSNAVQAYKIAERGDLDNSGGDLKQLDRLIARQNHLVHGKIQGASDLFVYTVREGDCNRLTGCLVFPAQPVKAPVTSQDLFVADGEAIYKQYAAVIGRNSDSLLVVDVTNPSALSSGARGHITDGGSLELDGPSGIEYYPRNGKHYAVVVSFDDDGIQIIDVTNPNRPTAADHLSDNADLLLDGAEGVAIYTVEGRTYAVVAARYDDGIQIVDITNPADIFPAGKLRDTGSLLMDRLRDVAIHQIGDRHYAVVTSVNEDGIQVVDITDPYNPVPKANIRDTGAPVLDSASGIDTFSIGPRHYAIVTAEGENGVQIIEMTVLTADAGGDRVIPGNIDEISLDGSASTVSSGVSPTYLWSQTGGPPVALSVPTIASPNFPPPAAPQVLSFLLTVSHGNVQVTDTVTITLEGNPATDVASFGGHISGDAVNVGTVTNPTGGGTSQYISMHFAGEGESQTFTYRLLEAPSGTVTVDFSTFVQSEPYGRPGYTWDAQAVSVSPRTLTFTPSNWYTPQVVTVTSQTDGDNTSEQAIIVIMSSAPGSYSGIHVTVDDRPGSPGTSGTSGGPIVLESAQRPVITLSGPYVMEVQLNSVWTDPGYTATDADGNDITASVTVTGAVDTAQAGTYLLYYQVADGSGTPATPQIRSVNVVAPAPQYQAPEPVQDPQPEPQQEPEQEPTQEPTQEPEQEPAQEPEQDPEQEPAQEPEQDPEQEPTQEPTQEPEQEPAQEPEQDHEQEPAQEPEQEPEGTESDQQQTCDIPAIVRQYDTDGSCKIERAEWLVVVDDAAAQRLTAPEVQTIAAHRG